MVRVQGRGRKENKAKMEREQDRVIVQAGAEGEVVRKEISVRIIVACGHDTKPFETSRRQRGSSC